MTVPLWAPFAFLAGVCCAYPTPRWVRPFEWTVVAALAYCVAVWAIVGLIVWWQVW